MSLPDVWGPRILQLWISLVHSTDNTYLLSLWGGCLLSLFLRQDWRVHDKNTFPPHFACLLWSLVISRQMSKRRKKKTRLSSHMALSDPVSPHVAEISMTVQTRDSACYPKHVRIASRGPKKKLYSSRSVIPPRLLSPVTI